MFKRSWSILAVLLGCLLVVLSAGTAVAQTSATTGEVSGRVLDNEESPLPGVTVTAINAGTGLTRLTVTDENGNFNLGLLPPGTYRVSAELSGFRTDTREDVTVLLGTATNVRFSIRPELSEEITVTADAPVVDTTEPGLTTSVTREQIENLPILGRDFSDLILLTPGATEAFGERVSLNGARGIQSDFNIDGAEANSDFFGEERGGTEAPFVFSQAAIQEFQVLRSSYNAEYGRGVGATLNAITKSGTNDFEGQAFYFLRDQDWADERGATLNGNQVDEFFEARDSDQYGFAFGGPIVRDRIHFFLNADLQDISEPLNAPDFRNDRDFQALSPEVQSQFLQRAGQFLGNSPTDEFEFDSTEDQETYLAKMDANLATNHHLSLRHNYADFNNFPSEGSGDVLSNNGEERNTVNSTVLQVDSVLGNSMSNQLVVQFGTEERPINALNNSLPETIIENIGYTFGRSEFLPNRTDEEKWQLKDSVTWFWNNHQLKGGIEYLSTEIDNLFPREAGGQYVFPNVEAFLANRPSRLDQGFGPTLGLNSFDFEAYGVFLQDSLTLNNVTVDLGVRYDRHSLPEPAGNAYPTHPEFVDDFTEDTDNFAPRLGVAWDVRGDGRSVLRGGVGRFFTPLPSILYAGPTAEIAGLYNRISVNCATATCPQYPNIFTPEQFAQFARTATNVTIVSEDLRDPESWRASLGFEQQLGTSYSVSLEGVFARLDNQQRLVNINAVPTSLTYGDLRVYDLRSPNRLYPDLQAVRAHVSDAEGEYTALTVSTRKLAMGDSRFTWLAHYTWSEAIDQDSNERSTSTSFSLDPFDPEVSEGFADYDVRHRFVASGTYELPWGGVLLSGIFTWRTGTPYTAALDVLGFNGLNGLDAQGVDTPVFLDGNGSIIDLTLANGLTAQGLSDFLAARGARLQERNSERQPDYRNLDLRLSKTFDLGVIGLELIGEVFNVLNEENEFITLRNQTAFTGSLTNGVWTFTRNPDFGESNSFNSASLPRQYQAALKIRF